LNSRREELNQRQPPMRCVATLRSNKLSLRQQKLWPRRPRPRQDRLHNLSPLAAVLTRSAYHLPVSRVVFGGRPSTRPFPILAFELTPEGIKRAEDVDLSKSVRRKTGRKLDFFIIAVLLLVISILLFQRFRPNVSPAVSSSLEKSIAVLPFDNLSHDPDNAYFADGIQEEILTRLSKIADLKVISRTSTQHFKSSPDNLPQIAKQLGVANILEGSVQKVADQVRVNVQLINAKLFRTGTTQGLDISCITNGQPVPFKLPTNASKLP
jgi:TolB-like protein